MAAPPAILSSFSNVFFPEKKRFSIFTVLPDIDDVKGAGDRAEMQQPVQVLGEHQPGLP